MPAPGSTPQDINGLYALIGLISDPDAAKKRLDELVEANTKAEVTKAVADKAYADAKAINDELHGVAETLKAKEKVLNAKEAELDEREKSLESTYSTKAQFLNKRQSDLDLKSSALDEREKAVKADTGRLEALVKETSDLKADYESRIAKIKAAAA